ncbi:MAG: hypothetical protein SGARI_008289, partial [Bacillariaceae sp.]
QTTNEDVEHFTLRAFDHDDGSCASYNTEATLKEGEWKSVSASKNGESTIQNLVEAYITATDCYVKYNIYTCDDITNQSKCDDNNAYKASCGDYYIFYAADKKVCKAVTDDDGNLMYDDDGEPYGTCDSCDWQDKTWGRRKKRALRGGAPGSMGGMMMTMMPTMMPSMM